MKLRWIGMLYVAFVVAAARAQDLPTDRVEEILVYANDARFSASAKREYAGEHVRGAYRVHLDATHHVTDIEVVDSILGADDGVRKVLSKFVFNDHPPVFVKPVELTFVAPLPEGQYRAVPPVLLEKQIVQRPAPLLTPEVRKANAGKSLSGMYLIYVERDGSVSRVDVAQSIAGADESIVATLKQWKLKPQPERIKSMETLTFHIDRR